MPLPTSRDRPRRFWRWVRAGVRWGVTLAAVGLLGIAVASHSLVMMRAWAGIDPQPPGGGSITVTGGRVMWTAQQGFSAWGPVGGGAMVEYKARPWDSSHYHQMRWWLPLGSRHRVLQVVVGEFPLWPWVILCGGVAAGLWAAPLVARRRRRAGVCACGYSLAGLPAGAACPECGAGGVGAGGAGTGGEARGR